MKIIRIPRFTNKEKHVFIDSTLFMVDEQAGLLLCSETGGMIMLDGELCREILSHNINNDFWFKLVQRKIAEPAQKRERDTHPPPDERVSFFLLDLTRQCNLRCVYCFRAHEPPAFMPPATIERAIDKIAECAKLQQTEFVSVQLWGGEPLLAMDSVKIVHRRLKSYGLNFRIEIESNGTVITRKMAEELREMGVCVGVSVDGDAATHNRQRKTVDGYDTFNEVRAGVFNLQSVFPPKSISSICVITRYNFRNVNRMLYSLVNDLGIQNVKFNLARDNPNAAEKTLSLEDDDLVEFANNLFITVLDFWKRGVRVYEGTICDRIRNLLDNSRHNLCNSKGCFGGKCLVSITSDGSIYPCEMTDFDDEKIGTVFSDEPIHWQIKKSIESHPFFAPKSDPLCDGCPWLSHCRGGCTSRQRFLGKTGIDRTECLLNKTIYPAIVRLLLSEPDVADAMIGGQ